MSANINIALDAMGGDNAPLEIVKGAVEAIKSDKRINIILVGKENEINEELKKYNYEKDRIEILDANEIIGFDESPVKAIRKKKDSSIVKGLNLVKEGKAEAFVSAGSTGALLAGGTFIVGRIKGVERPALAPFIPTQKGVSLLIDCGANVDSKASYLVQYGKMGSIYYENVIGVKDPKVGIINIGVEEEKGNKLVKEAFPLMKEADFNFIGSVEARDIPSGAAEVLVCDAFVGNIILKHTEGFGKTLLGVLKGTMMKNTITKIGSLLLKKSLKEALKPYDYKQYGGAPMLGIEGLVVKAHGSADANTIKNTLIQCVKFSEADIKEKIKENI